MRSRKLQTKVSCQHLWLKFSYSCQPPLWAWFQYSTFENMYMSKNRAKTAGIFHILLRIKGDKRFCHIPSVSLLPLAPQIWSTLLRSFILIGPALEAGVRFPKMTSSCGIPLNLFRPRVSRTEHLKQWTEVACTLITHSILQKVNTFQNILTLILPLILFCLHLISKPFISFKGLSHSEVILIKIKRS